jgi:sugar lactone lactonase YvrE
MQPGTRLGAYEIAAQIGSGGMGEVYRATDTNLKRGVAIKVLPESVAADRERLARFQREAEVLASLNHPNIAAIYGLERSDGITALVMELVEGPTLADRIAQGPIPVDEALPIAKQIAEALDAAHEQGIIHRDLKPANIKLRPDGVVKVLDFGLAKALEPASLIGVDATASPTITSPAMMTGVGMLLGTAAYMSPEQARGKAVDKRSDIWAFGCVLYEMLTGKSAFGAEELTDTLALVLTRDPDWAALPSSTPPAVRRLLQRCLQRDRKYRLADIADATLEIDDALGSTRETSGPQALVARRAIRLVAWMTAATIAAIATFVAGSWWNAGGNASAMQWHGERLGGSAVAMGPRISPDGQTLAFQAMVDGLTQVAVMKPQSGNWTTLTRDRTRGQVTTIGWSNDGTTLFFDRVLDVPRGVFSVPVLGGDERLVLEDAMGPEVLPDGSLLVTRINDQRVLQLYRFWPGTGRLESLPASVAPILSSAVRVFPDGREAVFIGRPLAAEQAPNNLYVVDLISHTVRRVGEAVTIPFGYYLPLAVSPDGQSILVDFPAGNLHRIVAIPRDGSEQVLPLVTLTELPLWLDVGRDGSLYVDQAERPAEILRVSPGSRVMERMPAPARTDVGGAQASLPLPDGRVLVTKRILGREQLMVVAPGKDALPFLATEEDNTGPLAMIGATGVGFIVGTGSARRIAIASVTDGRIVRRLTRVDGGAVQGLAGSADGQTIFYAASGAVWSVAVDDGTPHRIRAGDAVAIDATRNELVVQLNETNGVRLVRVSTSGNEERSVPLPKNVRLPVTPLSGNAVRPDGLLAIRLVPNDSWFWPAAILDLATGHLEEIRGPEPADMLSPGWDNNGRLVTLAMVMRAGLWRFSPQNDRP